MLLDLIAERQTEQGRLAFKTRELATTQGIFTKGSEAIFSYKAAGGGILERATVDRHESVLAPDAFAPLQGGSFCRTKTFGCVTRSGFPGAEGLAIKQSANAGSYGYCHCTALMQ